MGRLGLAMGLLATLAMGVGCDALSGKSGADTSEDDDGASKKKKKKKKKKDQDDDDDETGGDEDLDVSAVFGESATFGGAFDMFGEHSFGATTHSPFEPDNFSAGWAGREAQEVLKRARDRELQASQVRLPSNRVCLVFKEGNTIRRAMIATRRDAPTEELAFAANGNLILWYRHNRQSQSFEDWAYFHRGNNLMLYQTRARGGSRQADNAPATLRTHILGGARECIQAASAANPNPGTPAPVMPEPPPPGGGNNDPAPTALHFGAFAFSESASAWRISYRMGSEDEAKRAALDGCTQADCQVRHVYTKGQCMSIVHGPSALVTWGWADDNNTAQTNALEQCTQRGNTLATCEVRGTWCNDG